MPMMIDDIDDLFTDTLNVPPPSPIPGLLERVEELRLSGCCQKIVWSKFGSLAYITADGKGIGILNLCLRPKDGTWVQNLQIDSLLPDHISKIFKGRKLCHIIWSHTGHELLVVDVFGRLAIFTVFITINRLAASKTWTAEPEDNLNALVGVTWLIAKRLMPLYRAAIKDDDKWTYPFTQYETRGPFNPFPGKPSFVAVTRGGYVKLCYQDPSNAWQDVKHELDGFTTSADLLTHAFLCQDKDDTLLLVVHTANKRLRLYRASVDWPRPKPEDKQLPLAAMSFQHLSTVDDCCYRSEDAMSQSDAFLPSFGDAQISHLEILPGSPDLQDSTPTLPTIVAIFSYTPNHYNSSDLRDSAFSVISRWELKNEKPMLSPSFAQLTLKQPNVLTDGLKEEPTLKRLDDVRIHKLILQIQQFSQGLIIAFYYSDGSVEFRDRANMELLPLDNTNDKVCGLVQLGFGFGDTEPCLNVALSQNACIRASIREDCFPKISALQMQNEQLHFVDEATLEKITIAFTLLYTAADCSSVNSDDVVMTIRNFVLQLDSDQSPITPERIVKFENGILLETLGTLGVNLDRNSEPWTDKFLRYHVIQRCLSLQVAFGYKGEDAPRSLPSRVAWILLNLRLIALSIAFVFQKTQNAPGADIDLSAPESFNYMLGQVKWFMTLTDYLVDQIFDLIRSLDCPRPFDLETLEAKINQQASPALLIILVSTSRQFLKYNCRGLRGFETLVKNHVAVPSSNLYTGALLFEQLQKNSHATPRQLEHLLGELDSAIGKAYKAASLTAANRQAVETSMLVTGTIPPLFLPVLRSILTGSANKLRTDIAEAELSFSDFSMLGVGDDARTRRWWRTHTLDAIRKIVIRRDGHGAVRTRLCVRCAAVMEDLIPTRGIRPWMLNMQRTCFCGAFWMLEQGG